MTTNSTFEHMQAVFAHRLSNKDYKIVNHSDGRGNVASINKTIDDDVKRDLQTYIDLFKREEVVCFQRKLFGVFPLNELTCEFTNYD